MSLVFLAAVIFLADSFFPLNLPRPGESGNRTFARLVVDENDEPLRAFPDANGVWRYQVTQEEVSKFYLTALINYEDRWFYWHPWCQSDFVDAG